MVFINAHVEPQRARELMNIQPKEILTVILQYFQFHIIWVMLIPIVIPVKSIGMMEMQKNGMS